MKKLILVVCLLGFHSSLFGSQELDCSLGNSCHHLEGGVEFSVLDVLSVHEETIDEDFVDGYRTLHIKVGGYFPTLVSGKPITGIEWYQGSPVLFIMAPVSDLESPSYVTKEFIVIVWDNPSKIYFISGRPGNSQNKLLGEY